ncbi:High-affinity zinc uptake system membrane protein ZnuB [Clostridium sp. N3C]|uniref:metal ABC transporter permease n=1 Tax=Clostridium sp. N3C TaxID=1776758 RepID=UPI00092E14D3|nr:metal ABC transporter permease [Clostridium sp. N3C]SCN25062.1 High-affinity zinc uptake system membrane protein ZnuB [Clostridium sp. N3C]
MNNIVAKLGFYLQYPFVQYALIVGVLIAFCSSLLGVILVLKRYSFIGDGLSHVAFGAMAIGTVLNLADHIVLTMPVTIISTIILLKGGKNAKIKGDAAIAILSVGSLAIGYLVMNVFATSSNISGDVCTTLFGSTSILTLTEEDVMMCLIFSFISIIIFVVFYNRFFAVTFDENFVKATGGKAELYNLIIAIVIAIIIVLGMNLVGSLLISALIIFPVLSSMRMMHSFKGVVILSGFISVFCALIGILVSIVFSTPVGSTIVVADMALFLICSLIAKIRRI